GWLRSKISFPVFLFLWLACLHPDLPAQTRAENCPRPAFGSKVTEPENLHSRNGLLKVDLTARHQKGKDGTTRLCLIDTVGNESPTLRVNPGDLVVLTLRNELTSLVSGAPDASHQHLHMDTDLNRGRVCGASDSMSEESTNLHFHGLTIPPTCHQD